MIHLLWHFWDESRSNLWRERRTDNDDDEYDFDDDVSDIYSRFVSEQRVLAKRAHVYAYHPVAERISLLRNVLLKSRDAYRWDVPQEFTFIYLQNCVAAI